MAEDLGDESLRKESYGSGRSECPYHAWKGDCQDACEEEVYCNGQTHSNLWTDC